MQYSYLKVSGNVTVGNVLSYDNTLSLWSPANSEEGLIGVAVGQPVEKDEGFYTYVCFVNIVQALASQDIPIEGGVLGVQEGQVYVKPSSSNTIRNYYILPSDNPISAGEFCMIKL